jgi:NDP-sugar pyrophosphorylase family protein
MSGNGNRFLRAGYEDLKPLIKIGEESMIERVLSRYPSKSDPIVILNVDHGQHERLTREIKRLRPEAKIVNISSHNLGPSHAVAQALHVINPNKKIVVSYCDVLAEYDNSKLLAELESAEGVFVTHKGYFPYQQRGTNFGCVEIDETGLINRIIEKKISLHPEEEYASSGVYGFKNIDFLESCLKYQVKTGLSNDNEFYISRALEYALISGLKIANVSAQNFISLGTPEDVEEINYWTALFHEISIHESENSNFLEMQSIRSNLIVLAAGQGSRIDQGVPKPALKFLGTPLWRFSWPKELATSNIISKLITQSKFADFFSDYIEETSLLLLDAVTPGQAHTAYRAITEPGLNANSFPMTFLSCDNLMDTGRYLSASVFDQDWDVLIWVAENYLDAKVNPSQFSWAICDSNLDIIGVEFKKFTNLPRSYPLIGGFTFRTMRLAEELLKEVIEVAEKSKIESYLDQVLEICLTKGISIRPYLIKDYATVGTETEYKKAKYYETAYCSYFSSTPCK